MQTLSDVLQAANNLSHSDRAELAHAMLISLEPEGEDENVEQAWAEEIRRRLARIRSGESELKDWETVRAEILESLSKQGLK